MSLVSINGKETPDLILHEVSEMKPQAVLVAVLKEDGGAMVISSHMKLADMGWLLANVQGSVLKWIEDHG